MSKPLTPLTHEELNRICSACQWCFAIHSFRGQLCPIGGYGMINGWMASTFTSNKIVPKMQSICPCGIVRTDCDYHK